jgi:hypothetical protein
MVLESNGYGVTCAAVRVHGVQVGSRAIHTTEYERGADLALVLEEVLL